eukprot:TRINITY_DN7995_c0_g1_i1.p1 TRINITY_DN7995_c0_g1~~TRINITY_DN7995_c0_g1_i1.p1  ORF type:complete len:202 (+),score=25.87 TRINITY_DN7995_c0_g1_i1:229-834(+)
MEAAVTAHRPSTFHFPGTGSARPRSLLRPIAQSYRVQYCSISASRDNSALKKGGSSVPSTNYVVPLDSHPASSSCLTRPLVEILRDLNKRVPDKVLKSDSPVESKYIPWYHANRMLSFYAPGWCGEVRNIIFSADGRAVSVVYRVTVRASDGEAYREASGTASLDDCEVDDPVQLAEAMAFRRACARFGLGLYLYHDDESQ